MRELLASDAVRFHLKQVAIQCLGQLDNPSAEEVGLALDLFRQPDWRGHIADYLVFNNPTWFGLFNDRGEWRAILALGRQHGRRIAAVIDAVGTRAMRMGRVFSRRAWNEVATAFTGVLP